MSTEKRTYQYYYRDKNCTAESAYSKDCICWHNEGEGAFINARHDDDEESDERIIRNWRLR